MLKGATYQPGQAAIDAELFGPRPNHDMALAFVEMCRDVGWTIENSLALSRKIRLKGKYNETEPSV